MCLTTSAYAASTIGNVSVTVGPPPITIGQDTKGNIITGGQEPLYCDTDPQGNITCYY